MVEKAARATRPAEQQQQRSPPAAAARAGSSKPGHADDSHILRKEDLKEAVLLVQNKLAAQLELAAPGRRPAAFCSAASSTLAEPAATTTGQTAAAQVGQAPAAEPCAALLHPRCASNLCALSAQGALASSCTATNRISSLCLAGTSPLGGAERSHFAARRSLHHRGKRGQGRLHSREASQRDLTVYGQFSPVQVSDACPRIKCRSSAGSTLSTIVDVDIMPMLISGEDGGGAER